MSVFRFSPVHLFAPLPDLPQVPADLGAATVDELNAFLAAVDTLATQLSEAGAMDGLTQADLDRLRALAASATEVRAAVASRAAADPAAAASALDALRTPAAAPADAPAAPPAAPEPTAGSDPAPAPVPAPVDTPGVTPDAVTASGAGLPTPEPTPVVPAGVSRPDALRPEFSITAGADIPGYSLGQDLGTGQEALLEIARALVTRRSGIHHVAEGTSDYLSVATLRYDGIEGRELKARNGVDANMAIINAVTDRQSITAAGGICAPLQPYYEIMVLAGAQRPVRDGAFVGFTVDRGGITLVPPPTLASVGTKARTVADGVTVSGSNVVTSATAAFLSYDKGATITGTGIPANTLIIDVSADQTTATLSANATASATVSITITRQSVSTIITAAADGLALGGTPAQIAAALKPCLHIVCGSAVSYTVNAITRCLEVGNLSGMTYPEQVAAWLQLAISYQARLAETKLLDFLSSNSTQVTAAQVLGAARDLVPVVIKMAAYFRQHNRMATDAPLHFVGPSWLIEACVCDLMIGSVYDSDFLERARAIFDAAFAEAGITTTWYIDSGTGKGQYFNSGNAQAGGAATTFPSTAVWYLYPTGSFLLLEGGTLDLGIVRDSLLNAQNNYRLFAETWEAGAYVGIESLEVTSTLKVNGTGVLPIANNSGAL